MGDWSKAALLDWYPHLATVPCAGCGESIAEKDEHCYANGTNIWHVGCWPRVTHPSTNYLTAADVLTAPPSVSEEGRDGD